MIHNKLVRTRVGEPGNSQRIDPALRDRVMEEISILREALEVAIADATDENLERLREAADKLMRALGRVLIEVERQRGA